MSFKFFSDRIVTSDVSLDEAVKKARLAKPEEVPSLDDLLGRIDAENKSIKTASSEKEVKTAEAPEVPEVAVEKSDVQVTVADELKKEAKEAFPGAAPPFGSKDKSDDSDKCDCGKDDCDCKKDDDKDDDKEASTKKSVQMKLAKKIDFRQWEAEDVVKAWSQHGSVEACIGNVKDLTDNPRVYCSLLHAASGMAKANLKKVASAAPPATADKPSGPIWKKLAKLTDTERTMLDKYWRKLYGDYYVDAMLSDY